MTILKNMFFILIFFFIILCISCSDESTSPGENSNPDSLTDVDGNVYQTVKIGDQVWMVENLKVTHYRNGEAIPNVTDDREWSHLTSGAYCAYSNDSTNIETYGLLYNWYAVSSTNIITPEGWHVPTDEEWKELEMHLGMGQSEVDTIFWRGTDEGGKLKETGTTHWNNPNTGATDESGFTALPGGYRLNYNGAFTNIGNDGYWWSATWYSTVSAWYRTLSYGNSDIYRSSNHKKCGFSVRCIMD